MGRSDRRFFSFLWLPTVFLIAALILRLALGAAAPQDDEKVQTIAVWQWEGRELSLPVRLPCLEHPGEVILTAQIMPSEGDHIYLKTVYAPLEVYADGELVFSYGQPGSYPAFLLDPPTKVALFPLPDTGRAVTLTFIYQPPTQRDHMALHPILVGSSSAILSRLFSTMGFSLLFAGVLVTMGILLWCASLAVTRFEKKGIALFWLGLFSFCCGSWVLGECNLTGLFIKNPGLLYGMAFCGLFTVGIPISRFCMILFGSHQKRLLAAMCHILELSVCAALILQLTGTASLARTMYLFHVLGPLTFCLCGACILQESLRYHDPMARRFLFPMAVLTLFALLEVADYYLFHWDVQRSFFFQLGVLVFQLMVSVLCGYFIRDSLGLAMENRQLGFEVSLMEKQIRAQKERYQFLSQASVMLRQQRHDLKHHMAVIRRWTASGEREKLLDYLDQVSARFPEGSLEDLCENEAVNAVALHYQAAAREAKILTTIRLDIPEDTGQVPASDLCVIVGNLLENGVHACCGVKAPFLTMQSRLSDGILTITMDNAYSSVTKAPDGTFCSPRADGGMGLPSIRSMAERYGGGCRFEDRDGVFCSSVYLYLFRTGPGD